MNDKKNNKPAETLLKPGNVLYIRCVTFHYVGVVADYRETQDGEPVWILLKDACWIADTGKRMQDFVREGIITSGDSKTEYERYPYGVLINAQSVVDIAEFPAPPPSWEGPLPERESDDKKDAPSYNTVDDFLRLGNRVYVRAVTFHTVGQIVGVEEKRNDSLKYLHLDNAAWIADSGVRTEKFLASGISTQDGSGRTEFETYAKSIMIAGGAIVDIAPFHHDVPFGSEGREFKVNAARSA